MSATNPDPHRPSLNRALLFWALASAVLLSSISAAAGYAAGRAGPVALGSPPTASADGLLLPDLVTLPPEDLEIEVDDDAHERHLALSNTVWNAGEGPLEIRGEQILGTDRARVSQRLYPVKGPPEERPAGEVAHHEEHGPVHFEGFALYELLSLTPEGGLGSVAASGNKTTYCLMETTQVDRELSGRTRQGDHDGCGEEVQGISPGWGDTYGAGVEGQEINVEAVFDGTYALRSTADPDDLLLESDEENNSAITYLEIEGDEVRVLDGPPEGSPQSPAGAVPRTENKGRSR